jgi:hypothetical protein
VHASDNYRRVVEVVQSGALGKIHLARVWIANTRERDNKLGHPPDSDPPAGLDWDFWLGPAPKRPFNIPRPAGRRGEPVPVPRVSCTMEIARLRCTNKSPPLSNTPLEPSPQRARNAFIQSHTNCIDKSDSQSYIVSDNQSGMELPNG